MSCEEYLTSLLAYTLNYHMPMCIFASKFVLTGTKRKIANGMYQYGSYQRRNEGTYMYVIFFTWLYEGTRMEQ